MRPYSVRKTGRAYLQRIAFDAQILVRRAPTSSCGGSIRKGEHSVAVFVGMDDSAAIRTGRRAKMGDAEEQGKEENHVKEFHVVNHAGLSSEKAAHLCQHFKQTGKDELSRWVSVSVL
jgi:antirestriction protein ArdC